MPVGQVAGTGVVTALPIDGPCSSARLLGPRSLMLDQNDDLIFVDAATPGGTGVVRKLSSPESAACRVDTVIGDGKLSGLHLGALPAWTASPGGLALSPAFDWVLSDTPENAVVVYHP